MIEFPGSFVLKVVLKLHGQFLGRNLQFYVLKPLHASSITCSSTYHSPQILRSSLIGGYVNFGVFQLYGDECHMNAINMFIKMLGALPDRALMVSYVKCLRRLYT